MGLGQTSPFNCIKHPEADAVPNLISHESFLLIPRAFNLFEWSAPIKQVLSDLV